MSIPESVLADAFFPKGNYKPDELFRKIADLIEKLPTRPRVGKSSKTAAWGQNDKGTIAVTGTECLRTFPVRTLSGVNEVECEFCSCMIPLNFDIFPFCAALENVFEGLPIHLRSAVTGQMVELLSHSRGEAHMDILGSSERSFLIRRLS